MIKSPALKLGIAMAAVAGGTYFGLDRLPNGVLPPPIGRAMAAEAPETAGPPSVTITAVTPGATSTAPAAPEAAPETTPEAAPEAASPADAAATAEPAPSAAAPAEPAPAAAAPEATPPEPMAPETTPAETPKADTAATTTPARTAPAADAIKPWWPDPSEMPANQLKLQYAGQVKGEDAIALLFSAPLKLETVQQHAIVRSAAGETVAGSWTLGKNPKLAVLDGLAPGRYTVVLQPQIADQKGYMLGATLTGPVYVKEH